MHMPTYGSMKDDNISINHPRIYAHKKATRCMKETSMKQRFSCLIMKSTPHR